MEAYTRKGVYIVLYVQQRPPPTTSTLINFFLDVPPEGSTSHKPQQGRVEENYKGKRRCKSRNSSFMIQLIKVSKTYLKYL